MTQTISQKLLITGGSGFIGTNLIDLASKKGILLLNVDIQPPLCKEQSHFWRRTDILDADSLKIAFLDFRPDWVVHLAARTDCDDATTVEDGYQVNTVGTENVLLAIRSTPSVSRAIITSTQFVCRPGVIPKNGDEYDPHTVYGQSKVLAEHLTRRANLGCTWTIIRPTNIWGPWHMRYRAQFLRALSKGAYLHPSGRSCTKSYGYVGNVVHQILRICEASPEVVHGKTLYVGDRPIDLLAWVNAFSQELRRKPVCTAPYWALRGLATVGDVMSLCMGRPFLINSRRFRSMTEDYIVPMEDTFRLLGESPFSLQEGVRATVKWLRDLDGGVSTA